MLKSSYTALPRRLRATRTRYVPGSSLGKRARTIVLPPESTSRYSPLIHTAGVRPKL
jgi:hypothetical protein